MFNNFRFLSCTRLFHLCNPAHSVFSKERNFSHRRLSHLFCKLTMQVHYSVISYDPLIALRSDTPNFQSLHHRLACSMSLRLRLKSSETTQPKHRLRSCAGEGVLDPSSTKPTTRSGPLMRHIEQLPRTKTGYPFGPQGALHISAAKF